MIKERPLISLKFKQWSTYDQLQLLASETPSSSISKNQKKPFKPGHFQANLSIKIDVPKCFEITVVMLIYNFTFLATTVSFPAILVPKTVSTFRFCLQHQLIGRLLGSQKILNRGIISQNQSFPSMSKDVLDLYNFTSELCTEMRQIFLLFRE